LVAKWRLETRLMLNVRPFNPSARIRLSHTARNSSGGVEAEIERLWIAEQSRRREPLFNGRILSASEIDPDCIVGAVVEYRHLIAQRARPDLFHELRVRPVAVSGVSECAAGVLFGRRAMSLTEAAGLWELCPSGGLDVSNAVAGDEVDYRAQLLIELREEVGVPAGAVASVAPFCLVEDLDTHVIDLGIALGLSMSSDEITAVHRNRASREYVELSIVPRENLTEFLAKNHDRITEVSTALLENAWRA
jgi:hypothetical protein